MSYAIVRNEKLTRAEINGKGTHNDRKAKKHTNKNIRSENNNVTTVGSSDITITHYYSKDASVIMRHLDKDDHTNEIAEPTYLSGIAGQTYTATPLTTLPARYVYRGNNSGNTTGTYTDEQIEVIFYYTRQSQVTVNYVDKVTGEKIETVSDAVDQNETLNKNSAFSFGNENNENEKDTDIHPFSDNKVEENKNNNPAQINEDNNKIQNIEVNEEKKDRDISKDKNENEKQNNNIKEKQNEIKSLFGEGSGIEGKNIFTQNTPFINFDEGKKEKNETIKLEKNSKHLFEGLFEKQKEPDFIKNQFNFGTNINTTNLIFNNKEKTNPLYNYQIKEGNLFGNIISFGNENMKKGSKPLFETNINNQNNINISVNENQVNNKGGGAGNNEEAKKEIKNIEIKEQNIKQNKEIDINRDVNQNDKNEEKVEIIIEKDLENNKDKIENKDIDKTDEKEKENKTEVKEKLFKDDKEIIKNITANENEEIKEDNIQKEIPLEKIKEDILIEDNKIIKKELKEDNTQKNISSEGKQNDIVTENIKIIEEHNDNNNIILLRQRRTNKSSYFN